MEELVSRSQKANRYVVLNVGLAWLWPLGRSSARNHNRQYRIDLAKKMASNNVNPPYVV